MTINVSAALNCFQEDIQLITRSTIIDANGRFVVTEDAPVTRLAVVQPGDKRELQNLPEGEQINGTKTFYTKFEVKAVNDLTGEMEDYIVHESRIYKIISVAPWCGYGFFKSQGALLKQSPP